jgi:hypothetical protein
MECANILKKLGYVRITKKINQKATKCWIPAIQLHNSTVMSSYFSDRGGNSENPSSETYSGQRLETVTTSNYEGGNSKAENTSATSELLPHEGGNNEVVTDETYVQQHLESTIEESYHLCSESSSILLNNDEAQVKNNTVFKVGDRVLGDEKQGEEIYQVWHDSAWRDATVLQEPFISDDPKQKVDGWKVHLISENKEVWIWKQEHIRLKLEIDF